ncbi:MULTISPECIES: flagellar basal body rod protein FlgB [unclassified Fusibacter]|uniref:flagellar basal body rod protein FlgB n=1 Tax=unclassified Fusibacter TaxID=2624464 RepID=UPI0010121020|nr:MULTISPECIES: flagellar basal body rod protein FlgB [unclassified Fusibacter]MCK8058751.1 flagellar basal body rod protein FlgB [Fusibacter sp. A2]NPE21825.1 flagellar basal body rod protein FlgB [Fusibacter sp. A1]RXV61397.1 flagellar basal body rod protein FlgB [Fusibacter sp. A1]
MLNNAFQAIDLQKKALDASWLRQDILSNNIANVNTPGYKRQDVEFENLLEDYLSGKRFSINATHPGHITDGFSGLDSVRPRVITEENTSLRIDGNNVNVDTEMAELAKNSIKYNAVVTDVNSQLRRLKSAISGGR